MRRAEAQKDWTAGEGWARADTERYPDAVWAVWLVYCKRSSHGDLAGAIAV
jgi:hypothetical protein